MRNVGSRQGWPTNITQDAHALWGKIQKLDGQGTHD